VAELGFNVTRRRSGKESALDPLGDRPRRSRSPRRWPTKLLPEAWRALACPNICSLASRFLRRARSPRRSPGAGGSRGATAEATDRMSSVARWASRRLLQQMKAVGDLAALRSALPDPLGVKSAARSRLTISISGRRASNSRSPWPSGSPGTSATVRRSRSTTIVP